MKKSLCLGLLTAFLLGAANVQTAKPVDPPGLTVVIEKTAITATGLTPAGDAVFFGVSHEPLPFSVVYATRERIATVASDGSARIELDTDIPLRAVWAVVDVTSGRYAVVSRDELISRKLVLSAGALKADNNGQLKKLDIPFELADILLVRPGAGAWMLSAADSIRGRILPSIDSFKRTGKKGATSAEKFEKGDVVIIFEPRRLLFYDFQVGN
jgi:hypothetical protein